MGLILKREYLLICRQRSEIILPWLFLLLVISLFPLGVNPDPALLRVIAPGIIWVGILLAQLLALEKLFRQEVSMGVMEQWLLAPAPFTGLIFAKVFANWLMYCVPLLLFLPIIGVWLPLNSHALLVLGETILLATPTLHFMGAIFSALTVNLRNNGLLLGVLTLPFYVPVLIFATIAVNNAQMALPATVPLALLGAILALTLPLAPVATAAALRIMLR